MRIGRAELGDDTRAHAQKIVIRPPERRRTLTRVSRLKDVCIDCTDPWSLSHWWAPVLGYQVRPHTDSDLADLRAQGFEGAEADPSIAVDPVGETGPTFWFNKVPEAKHTKNRVHVDVYGDVAALVGRGARVLDRRERWTVMADPEGNEFCVFPEITSGS